MLARLYRDRPRLPHPTKTKAAAALGPKELGRIMQNSPLTGVAIGGIDSNNLLNLLESGSENFCVVRAANEYADPVSAHPQSPNNLEKP